MDTLTTLGLFSAAGGTVTAGAVTLAQPMGYGLATGTLQLNTGAKMNVSGSVTTGGGTSTISVSDATLNVGGVVGSPTANIGTLNLSNATLGLTQVSPGSPGPRAVRPALLGLGVAGVVSLALIACAGDRPAVEGKPPHHREGGFRNNYTEVEPQFAALVRWRFEAWRDGRPPPPTAPTPMWVPDLGLIQSNAKAGAKVQPMVTWVGHATVLAQFAGINLLTDPMFSERASPLPFVGPLRKQRPGLWLNELPAIDVVLISHDHYDHLDEASVCALAAQPGGLPLFVVPLGLKFF